MTGTVFTNRVQSWARNARLEQPYPFQPSAPGRGAPSAEANRRPVACRRQPARPPVADDERVSPGALEPEGESRHPVREAGTGDEPAVVVDAHPTGGRQAGCGEPHDNAYRPSRFDER